MNKTLNLLSGVVALGLLGVPLGAQAAQFCGGLRWSARLDPTPSSTNGLIHS